MAWFRSGTFNIGSKTWRNAVQGGTSATLSGDGLRRVSKTGHGTLGAVTALEGTTADKINFGNVIKPQFTICSLTRYTGGTNRRILNGEGVNWLHGHHDGKAGVAYYSGWKTRSDGTNVAPVTDWVVMCGTNAESQLKLVNGVNKGIADGGSNIQSGGNRMWVNGGYVMPQQSSNFAIAEVMVWKRGLSSEEMYGVSDYLMGLSSEDPHSTFSIGQDVPLTEQTRISFSFALGQGSPGLKNQLCFKASQEVRHWLLTHPSSIYYLVLIFTKWQDFCFNLAGSAVGSNRLVEMSNSGTYEYDPDAPFKDFVIQINTNRNLLDNVLPDLSTGGLTISQITFRQICQPGTPTRSRLYDLKVYDGISVTVPDRTKTSVTVQLDFSGRGYDDEVIKKMHYRPTVKVQDVFGKYEREIVSV